jgi:hypothetical protein
MSNPKGLDVIVEFYNKTGQVLPDHFWKYWNEWCIACKEKNNIRIYELERHPRVEEYIVWITEIKTALGIKDIINDKEIYKIKEYKVE